ncbi:MAG: type III-A CRISPR-associated RAMP protein Csm4 [Desulfobacterales bacterium]|nr:type III-A CRISPR-associated RAMP protein Csm4 [Desulfobacterales bacterium]
MIAYKLNFTAPLHVDSQGTSFYEKADEFVHSDTLTAAIISCWRYLYDDSVDELAAHPPFTLSSAFPYYSDIYFFPRPLVDIFHEPEDGSESKTIKKIKWLSQPLFEQVLSGTLIDWNKERPELFAETFALLRDEAECLEEKSKSFRLMTVLERPRIAVNRIKDSAEEGSLFYFAEHYFREEAGLFFLAEFKNGTTRKKLDAVLQLLGDQGIGADRSVGKGTFIVEVDDLLELELPNDPELWITLSLYNPDRGEVKNGLLNEAAYDLTTRGGWISGTSLKKPPIKMFTEGSVFKQKPEGRTVGLFSEQQWKLLGLKNPILRHGRAFCLPMKGPK